MRISTYIHPQRYRVQKQEAQSLPGFKNSAEALPESSSTKSDAIVIRSQNQSSSDPLSYLDRAQRLLYPNHKPESESEGSSSDVIDAEFEDVFSTEMTTAVHGSAHKTSSAYSMWTSYEEADKGANVNVYV